MEILYNDLIDKWIELIDRDFDLEKDDSISLWKIPYNTNKIQIPILGDVLLGFFYKDKTNNHPHINGGINISTTHFSHFSISNNTQCFAFENKYPLVLIGFTAQPVITLHLEKPLQEGQSLYGIYAIIKSDERYLLAYNIPYFEACTNMWAICTSGYFHISNPNYWYDHISLIEHMFHRPTNSIKFIKIPNFQDLFQQRYWKFVVERKKKEVDIYREELIQRTWHPKRVIDWCLDVSEQKDFNTTS